MNLHIFNLDADLALGNNEDNYMPPASISCIAEDLALLPVWYAPPGSAVLTPSAYNADYLKQMQQMFPSEEVYLISESEVLNYADIQIMPWAWNRAIRRRMIKMGIPEQKLPTEESLDIYRRLSSRAYSLALYPLFVEYEVDYVCGCARLIKGDGKTPLPLDLIADFNDKLVIKSPWSSSGKGLYWCRNGFKKEASDWCYSLLRKYGCFTIEPMYDKVDDFALEYYCNGRGEICFVGYSRFMTNKKGAYLGNILTSDRQVEEWVQQYVPLDAFMRIRKVVEKGISTLYCSQYVGYLGIDMMVCRQEGKHPYVIHPCVEVNLRMNMGVVAHSVYTKLIVPGAEGRFFIESFSSNEALRDRHEQYLSSYPLIIKDGKIISGYMSLVPVTHKSMSQAYILVGPSE